MRVGFAEYLNPETSFKIDHWITKYWDPSRNAGYWSILMSVNSICDRMLISTRPALPGHLARAGKVRSDLFPFKRSLEGASVYPGKFITRFPGPQQT